MFLIHSNTTRVCTPPSQLDLYLSLVPTFGGMQHLLPFENMRAANASLAPLFIVAIKLKLMLNGHALCVTVDQEEVQWAVLI